MYFSGNWVASECFYSSPEFSSPCGFSEPSGNEIILLLLHFPFFKSAFYCAGKWKGLKQTKFFQGNEAQTPEEVGFLSFTPLLLYWSGKFLPPKNRWNTMILLIMNSTESSGKTKISPGGGFPIVKKGEE